jgi:two-component system OmpR family sensor kinase
VSDAKDHRRFLRRLDHELKNPLTAIQVGLANLAETTDEASRRQIQASIQTQVQRLGTLVDNLRKLADLETGDLEYTSIDVAGLLTEVFEAAQELPGASERRFKLSLSKTPPLAIMGDYDLLLRAVYNLLDNAVKFTQPGDKIELSACRDGDRVVIKVIDTGAGIAEEDLPHVWDELYRSQDARAVPGSGIGLAMVKTIVERHDGRVDLRSTVHKETVVLLHLPI